MVSTVTTSTISTITTMWASGLITAIGALVTVTLIAFLVSRELAGATSSIQTRLRIKFLNIAIVPMLITFAAIVIFKMLEILV